MDGLIHGPRFPLVNAIWRMGGIDGLTTSEMNRLNRDDLVYHPQNHGVYNVFNQEEQPELLQPLLHSVPHSWLERAIPSSKDLVHGTVERLVSQHIPSPGVLRINTERYNQIIPLHWDYRGLMVRYQYDIRAMNSDIYQLHVDITETWYWNDDPLSSDSDNFDASTFTANQTNRYSRVAQPHWTSIKGVPRLERAHANQVLRGEFNSKLGKLTSLPLDSTWGLTMDAVKELDPYATRAFETVFEVISAIISLGSLDKLLQHLRSGGLNPREIRNISELDFYNKHISKTFFTRRRQFSHAVDVGENFEEGAIEYVYSYFDKDVSFSKSELPQADVMNLWRIVLEKDPKASFSVRKWLKSSIQGLSFAAVYSAVAHGDYLALQKALSGTYLEWIFQTKPTSKEILSYLDTIKNGLSEHRVVRKTDVFYFLEEELGIVTERQHISIDCRLSPSTLESWVLLLDRYGALPTFAGAWSIVPFSFVVDWKMPFGDILSALDDYFIRTAPWVLTYRTASLTYTATFDDFSYPISGPLKSKVYRRLTSRHFGQPTDSRKFSIKQFDRRILPTAAALASSIAT
jgi:hypothetical protein